MNGDTASILGLYIATLRQVSMSNSPILVVEDEPDAQELVVRMLAGTHIAPDVVANAEDAWQMLISRPYVAVVIDLALPGKDGVELIHLIRSTTALSSVPCIAITAFHTPELKQRAMFEGFNAYFSKPLDPSRFLAEFDRILSGD